MQLGMIGLGRMGANMVRRLQKAGHHCVAFDRNTDSVKQVARDGAAAATSLDDLVKKLQKPRAEPIGGVSSPFSGLGAQTRADEDT